MKRLILLTAGVAAMMSMGILATSAVSSAAPSQRLTIVEHDAEGTITPADFGSAFAPNQQATEDAPAYLDGTKVGLVETVITVTRVTDTDQVAMIECTVELPRGNIFFNGTLHLADLTTGAQLPVLGGAGHYTGARGTVTVLAAADMSSTTLTFHFLDN